MKGVDLHDGAGDSGVRAQIRHSLRTWRRRLLWQRLLNTLAAIAVLVLVGSLRSTPASMLLQQSAVLALVFFLQLRLSSGWRRSNPGNFVEHLNRRFPDFEESAGLLLTEGNRLTPLQKLQRDRVMRVYRQNLAQVDRWRNPVRYRAALGVIAGSLLLGLFAQDIGSLATRLLIQSPAAPGERSADGAAALVNVVSVRIEPPAYTGLRAIQTRELDIGFPEGSRIDWVLDINTNDDGYALRLSGGETLALQRGDDGHLHTGAVINATDLYRIVRAATGSTQTIGGIHSLTVELDRPPDIRILEPQVSALEIPRSGPARFNSEALIEDDYGLQDVEIIASVAKGSGEGVKFRDQKLYFDQAGDTANGGIYQKEWDLEALGMEPGDEVYFTVTATDNRLPQANTGRSETLIVRWLDDEQAGPAAQGLAIDFVSEYFKSQRQIIIETEQLIEDRPQLAIPLFRDTAYAIGQAQADLKEKYGQYLGDEFGEGPGAQFGDSHETHGDTGDGHEPDETGAETNKTLNSTADIIRRYGHDHGDPEIGPITRRNPVALMKRAVSEMWQAERHLMQAEPELALPFEYEAYKYLKLARQADRIYVKRLGFEPPPVSEDNRLKGKLDEIVSYRLSSPEATSEMAENQSDQSLLISVYQILKEYTSESKFNETERQLLHQLSREFTQWSQQRATLIRHAASLEKLALGARLDDTDACETCRKDLETAIWNLIEDGNAQFHHPKSAWYDDDGLVNAYQRALRRIPAPDTDGGRK